jgi:hypothetical protein
MEAVEELQKRIDMLHVLAGIEVSESALGYALEVMQTTIATLDHAASHVVQSSGMTDDEWYEYRLAQDERERLKTQREKAKAQRERRKKASG